MKFKIDRIKFQAAINIVKDAVSTNGLPILQNVKMDTEGDGVLKLTCTNLDQTIFTNVPCEVQETGSVTAPARLLIQMVAALTDPVVEFNHDEHSSGKAVLTGGEVTYKIACMPASEFPNAAPVEGDKVKVGQKELKDIIRKTIYAASLDQTRRVLSGLCFQFADDGKVTVVGTDGRRLACVNETVTCSTAGEIVVPLSSIKYLQRLLSTEGDVDITMVQGSAAVFATDTWTMQTKLVDEKYPAWKAVIPKDIAYTIPVNRIEFIDAVRQVSIAINNDDCRISITLANGVMRFSASNANVSDAKAMIQAKYDGGTDIVINLNPHYLIDSLNSFDADYVNLNITDGSKPITFTTEGSENISVLMPLRIN